MKYLSLFAGVGGFDLGADAAGWQCVGQVERDPDCTAVLNRHWPTVPKWGDVTTFDPTMGATADVVVGGFPCQDVSTAGKRAGVGPGTRSGLFSEVLRIIEGIRATTNNSLPRWAILENVAGLLSVDRGRGFRAVIRELANVGAYLIEWAVLDSQHFGLPQRRERVFIAAAFSPTAASNGSEPVFAVSPGSCRCPQSGTGETYSRTGSNGTSTEELWAYSHTAMRPQMSLTVFPTLRAGGRGNAIAYQGVARMLTPVETERLQGWPDNHTAYRADGSMLTDSVRYRMVGNGVSAPVARWVCQQISNADGQP